MTKRPILALLLALCVGAAGPTWGQRATATIRGSVTDTTKAAVPGAQVTARNEDTGLTRSTVTNTSGLYAFPDLPPGSYEVQIELSGFKAAVRTRILVNVADVRAVDVELSPGDVAEVVTVEAAALGVKTIGGEVAGLVTGEQVRELPLNGRNFLQLATLMPGVSAPDFLNVKDKGLLGGSDLSVSGNPVTANLWTVDGANNNDVGSNRTILVYPSLEAIEEFKIHRASYGAEFGQAAGAQVNIITRGGTNQYHGSLFYSGRRDSLNSINYFLEQAGKDKEKLKRNDFGWSFGGPIIKDKLHFFVSQEWNRETRGSVRAAFVPTAAERQGDFSGALIPGCSSPRPIDPLTGQPFAGNRIPAGRLSPGGLAFLRLYPLPNTTPGPGSCNNWVESVNTPINWRQENVRVDWTLSDSTRLMLRYTQDSWTNNAPNLQSNLWGDDPFPAVDSNWDQPGRSLVATLSRNIGSHAVNTLQFSYSANEINVTRGGTEPGLNAEITAAIPSVFAQDLKAYGADLGHPVFWGNQGYGQALWNEAPFRNNQDLFILRDDYSAVFGKHNLKAGVLVSFNRKNEDSIGNGSAENSQFWGSAGVNGWGANTGNILADFLLRDMTFGFSESSVQRQVPQRWRDFEAYVSDSWKVSPTVTVDFGLRYSRFFNPYAADDRIANFDPASFNAALGGDPCNGLLYAPGSDFCRQAGFLGGAEGPNRSLFEQDTKLFAPRLGVAWDVSGKGTTALRAGLGQYFLRERLSPGLNMAGNPPFTSVVNGIRKLDTAVEPCAGCFSTSFGAPGSGRELRAATPKSWQWSLSLEHELRRNTTIELSYVGTRGSNLLRSSDINQVRASDRNANGVSDRLDYVRSSPADGTLRPYGVFGDRRINYWTHTGTSIYHSLQTQLISRFGRGSQFQASYTWSRTIANDPLDNSDGGLTAEVASLDLDNPGLDRGLARTHRKHIFNSSLVLMLPALDSQPGLAKTLFGDWEVATIVSAASGSPITVFTGGIPGLNGGPSGTGYTDNQRPNRVPGQPCRASGGPREQWLNPAAFTLTGFRLGEPGDSGRGVCEGPGFFQVDLSLYKNIQLSRRVKMQLRFDVFNVFNRVNFLRVDNTMNPISVTLDAPLASATRITGFEMPANFGQASGTRDPRQAQFGIKLIF
jgi:hypothetical protein